MEPLILFQLMLFLPCTLAATNFQYYFALPPNHPAYSPDSTIHISTFSSNNVTFVVRTKDTVLLQDSVSSTISVSIPVDNSLVVNTANYSDRHNGIFVEASDELVINPITSVFVQDGASADTFRVCRSESDAIPPSTNDYYVAAANSATNNLFSFILLVGQFNYTHVTINAQTDLEVPLDPQNATSTNFLVGSSHEFLLHEYDTLLIPSKGSDLTGTFVSSTRPLTVLGGHQCANIPVDSSGCDQVVTQIPPVRTWGKEFLLTPFEGIMSKQIHRVVAGHNGAILHHNCFGNDSISILYEPGQALDITTDYLTSCYLTSNQPVMVIVMSLGSLINGGGGTGPAISVIPSLRQFTNRVTFYGLTQTLFPVQFVTIKATTNHFAPRAITLDSKPLQGDWSIIWNLDYSEVEGYTCKVEISEGVHVISHDNTEGELSVLVYGYNDGDMKQSYVYDSHSEWIDISPQQTGPPTVNFEQSMHESQEEEGNPSIQIRLMGSNIDPSTTVTINVTCSPGTAGPNDYMLMTNNVTLDNDGNAIIEIRILDDQFAERKESFTVNIASDDVQIGQMDHATVSITDDDIMRLGYQTDLERNMTIGIKEGFIDGEDNVTTVVCGFLYVQDGDGTPGPNFTELQFTNKRTSYPIANIVFGYLTVIDSHDISVSISSPEIALSTFNQQPTCTSSAPGTMQPSPLATPQSTPEAVVCTPSSVVTTVTFTETCKTHVPIYTTQSSLMSVSTSTTTVQPIVSTSSSHTEPPLATTSSSRPSVSTSSSSSISISSSSSSVKPSSVSSTSVRQSSVSTSAQQPVTVTSSTQIIPTTSSTETRSTPVLSTKSNSLSTSQAHSSSFTPGATVGAFNSKQQNNSYELALALAILLPVVMCVFVLVSVVLCVLCYKRGQRTGHYKLPAAPVKL